MLMCVSFAGLVFPGSAAVNGGGTSSFYKYAWSILVVDDSGVGLAHVRISAQWQIWRVVFFSWAQRV